MGFPFLRFQVSIHDVLPQEHCNRAHFLTLSPLVQKLAAFCLVLGGCVSCTVLLFSLKVSDYYYFLLWNEEVCTFYITILIPSALTHSNLAYNPVQYSRFTDLLFPENFSLLFCFEIMQPLRFVTS